MVRRRGGGGGGEKKTERGLSCALFFFFAFRSPPSKILGQGWKVGPGRDREILSYGMISTSATSRHFSWCLILANITRNMIGVVALNCFSKIKGKEYAISIASSLCFKVRLSAKLLARNHANKTHFQSTYVLHLASS